MGGRKMALVKWDASYSVKVTRCDEDHQKLFALINTLHDAMLAGKGGEKIQQVVRELSSYTKFHFSAEEALLEKTNYTALLSHRAQHQDFVKRVDQFQKDLGEGKGGNSIFVLEFLKDWLAKHILQIDKKYSDHLNAKGIC
jgi:hemerythrin